MLLHLLQRYPTTLSHVLLEENDICDETKYAIRIALGESESDISSSDDDGACETKYVFVFTLDCFSYMYFMLAYGSTLT